MQPKLFSEDKNTKAAEFKKFLPVNVQFSYETFAPALALAEQNFIIPVLGKQLFAKLVAYYTGSTVKEKEQTLLEMVQFSLVRLAYWKSYNSLATMITDSGASSEVDQSKRLYRYQEDALMEELKTDGFNQLDVVLEFLEENIEDFPDFKFSDYYTTLQNSFIPTTKIFQQHYNIKGSRLVFLQMKYYISDVEQILLPHYIGRTLMENIMGDMANEKYKPILRQIQKFVVYMAIHNGVSELQKFPLEKGLVFERTTNDGKTVAPVSTKELERTRTFFMQQADAYKSVFINYLNKHKADFPEYAELAGQDAGASDFIERPSTKKTFFA